MAFAAANVNSTVFGNLRVTYGDWSSSVGDASGTVTVQGGRVYQALFTNQDTESPTYTPIPCSVSVSSGLATVTVYPQDTVTAGRFLIIHV